MSGLTEEQVFYLVRGQIVYLEPHQVHSLDDLIGMDDPCWPHWPKAWAQWAVDKRERERRDALIIPMATYRPRIL